MSRLKRWTRILILATALALPIPILVAGPAHAVEATQITDTFAAFQDGNWGWFKLVVEKDPSNNKGRVKITTWCEPNNIEGGTKIPCDAIQYAYDSNTNGKLELQVWVEGVGWSFPNAPGWRIVTNGVDYSPPSAGWALTSSWDCGGYFQDQYRGLISRFRAASSNEWSLWKERVTPTFNGYLC